MIKVGIVGGAGYTGLELTRLLLNHPKVEILTITSRSEIDNYVSDIFSSFRGHTSLKFSKFNDENLSKCDFIFFATPHGVAMHHVVSLLEKGVKIIDLSPDFRLKNKALFKEWYGVEHTSPVILSEAVYGLPEINRKKIRDARIIGLPGCYPTSVQLGLAPLFLQKNQIIDEKSLIADCKSGISGAGRKADIKTIFAENYENFKSYSVDGHRHLPEIKQGLKLMSKRIVELTFVPHLIPINRGIHSTLYARLLPDFYNIDFQKIFEDFFVDEPFVDVMPSGSHPDIRSVKSTNMARIAISRPQKGNTLVIVVVIDNLVKGAAGQGIQCFNIMCNFDETTGLIGLPIS